MKDSIHLFVFDSDGLVIEPEDAQIKLNIYDDVFEFFSNGDLVKVDTSILLDGSSTLICRSPITNVLFALFNYRELLQLYGLTPQELLTSLRLRSFMQIDKRELGVFAKVFLPYHQRYLLSDTDDFTLCKHRAMEDLHPLDWEYSWTNKTLKVEHEEDKIILTIEHNPSSFCTTPVYISHAGQSIELKKGINEIVFKYVDTEDAYIGNSFNGRYVGRMVPIAASHGL